MPNYKVVNKMSEESRYFLQYLIAVGCLLFFVLFIMASDELGKVRSEGVRRGVAEWYSEDGRMPTKWRYKGD